MKFIVIGRNGDVPFIQIREASDRFQLLCHLIEDCGEFDRVYDSDVERFLPKDIKVFPDKTLFILELA